MSEWNWDNHAWCPVGARKPVRQCNEERAAMIAEGKRLKSGIRDAETLLAAERDRRADLLDERDRLLDVYRQEYEAIHAGEIEAWRAERDQLKAELAHWRKSFDGHVYVRNEEWAAKCGAEAERDRLRDALRNTLCILLTFDIIEEHGVVKQARAALAEQKGGK